MDNFENWENRLYPSLVNNINYIIEKAPANGVFYDIGANTGLLSKKVFDKRPDLTFVLFEPVKKYYNRLVQRFSFSNNFICLNLALINENKNVTISVDSNNIGWNTLSIISEYGEQQEVTGCTLYEAYTRHNLPAPDFIKIDVEESEYYVIEGAKKLFETIIPKNLLIEIGVTKLSPLWEKEKSMIDYLFSIGYKKFENDYNSTFDAKFEL
jgi:FkbM family methyltransferase